MRGRGELLESAGFDWPFWAVVLAPDEPIATAEVYHKFDELLTKAVDVDRITLRHLDLCAPEAAGSVMYNMLTEAAFTVLPSLNQLAQQLLAAGAQAVQISGSGSALVCLFNSRGRASYVVDQLSPRLRDRAWIVHGGHL
jgi:4-diphosphocytidyl-2C-methyl-D-erythritol kinase